MTSTAFGSRLYLQRMFQVMLKIKFKIMNKFKINTPFSYSKLPVKLPNHKIERT